MLLKGHAQNGLTQSLLRKDSDSIHRIYYIGNPMRPIDISSTVDILAKSIGYRVGPRIVNKENSIEFGSHGSII
jgi:hypothetical protein